MTLEERMHELGLLRSTDDLLTQRERFLLETITELESRLKAAMERARIIEEMYDQEYGLEHGGVAKQLNQVQAAYERGLRDAADVKVTCWNMETMKPEGSTPLPEWARNAILALKDRGEK
jgi:hypothetical protein